MGRVHKALLRAASMKIALRESTSGIELQGELATSSWSMTKRKTTVIWTWEFGRYFLKSEQASLSLQGKQLIVFVANNKIWSSKKNQNIGKLVSAPMSLPISK